MKSKHTSSPPQLPAASNAPVHGFAELQPSTIASNLYPHSAQALTRLSDYVKDPETCLGAAARNLFEMLPDSNFWLNPLSECPKPLPASEIALLMNGRIFEVLKTTR